MSAILNRISQDIPSKSRKQELQITSLILDEEQEQVEISFFDGISFRLTPSDNYPSDPTDYYCDQDESTGTLHGNLEEICIQLQEMASRLQSSLPSNMIMNNNNNNNNSNTNNNNHRTASSAAIRSKNDTPSYVSMNDNDDDGADNSNNNSNNDDYIFSSQPEEITSTNNNASSSITSTSTTATVDPAQHLRSIAKRICKGSHFEFLYECDLHDDRVSLGAHHRKNVNCMAFISNLEPVVAGLRIDFGFRFNDLMTSKVTADAFGVNPDLPLEVQLWFERSDYIHSSLPPKEIKVYQTVAKTISTESINHKQETFSHIATKEEKEPCRFGQQLKGMLESYLFECWDRDKGFIAPKRLDVQKKLEEQNNIVNNSDRNNHFAAANADAKRQEITEKFIQYDELHGFIFHLISWLRHRIPTSAKFCVVCDSRHIGFGNSSKFLVRPCCCERQLCVHQFQKMNIGRDAADSMATGNGVLDLLVAMFRAAVNIDESETTRRAAVLDPYPSIVNQKTGELIFDPQHKDFNKLKKLTDQLPSADKLADATDDPSILDRLFQGKDPATLLLLNWIVSSNSSYFQKLPSFQQISKASTPHQFLLITASEEKQRRFDELKNKSGKPTKFGFHGSRPLNWHSILRNGLRVMSGTALQSSGAAYGSGIYFAFSMSTAQSYAQSTNYRGYDLSMAATAGNNNNKQQQQYFDSKSFVCVAVCEIVEGYTKSVSEGFCFTVDNEDAVLTRFLFVYTDMQSLGKSATLECREDSFVKQLRALVEQTHK